MQGKIRWPLALAKEIAVELVDLLTPSCERIVVAGSVRRGRLDVGDIELLCIPMLTDNLFFIDALDQAVKGLIGTSPRILAYRPNIRGSIIYGQKNKLLIHVPSGIGVDIFSTSAANWGMAFLVRTGSAAFNMKVMARLRALGTPGHAYAGITGRGGTEIDCPTEERVFELLHWDFIPPESRI